MSDSSNERATILVVDDEGLVRIMVADDLCDRNYRALEATSGDEAAELFRSGSGVDLVFTEVRMPAPSTVLHWAVGAAKRGRSKDPFKANSF